jgi:hypothetical protein
MIVVVDMECYFSCSLEQDSENKCDKNKCGTCPSIMRRIMRIPITRVVSG